MQLADPPPAVASPPRSTIRRTRSAVRDTAARARRPGPVDGPAAAGSPPLTAGGRGARVRHRAPSGVVPAPAGPSGEDAGRDPVPRPSPVEGPRARHPPAPLPPLRTTAAPAPYRGSRRVVVAAGQSATALRPWACCVNASAAPSPAGPVRRRGPRPQGRVPARTRAPGTRARHREQPGPALRHGGRGDPHTGRRPASTRPARACTPSGCRVSRPAAAGGEDHREQRHPDEGGEPLPRALRECGGQHGGESDADDSGPTGGVGACSGGCRSSGSSRAGVAHGPLSRGGGIGIGRGAPARHGADSSAR